VPRRSRSLSLQWELFVSENTALVVDDDISARMILSSMLDHIGCDSIAANDGSEALETVDTSGVSVVLCDWDMPGMSGIDLCTELRSRGDGRYIYFILVSGRTERESIFEGLEAGADDFICKPVDIDELTVKIKSAFRIVNLERQLEEKNQRLQRAYAAVTEDLVIAGKIQEDLLPAPYPGDSCNTGWLFKPAQYVSGDMFDYFKIDDNYWVFFMMDVEGHGIPSALTVFSVNNQLKPSEGGLCASMLKNSPTVADACINTVAELNKRSLQGGRYFTMIYGVLDITSGEVTMTQAGHPPAFHQSKASGEIVSIGDGGMPVGLLDSATFSSVSFKLECGDRLLVYSDGTLECTDSEANLYGNERMINRIKSLKDEPVTEVCRKFDEDLCQWNGDKPFDDDVSLLVIEYNGVTKSDQ
jgi:sigma-B regulation protein RsbU (phosphoserine phosphatase)